MDLTLHRRLRNATQWISIAQFLSKDPLLALGLEGGWARSAAAPADAGAPDPELVTPPSNTGVNKVGELAGVEREYRSPCFRCVVVAGSEIYVDQCESCK